MFDNLSLNNKYLYNIDRWLPLHLGSGKFTKNRLVVPPMFSDTAGEDGIASDKSVEHYGRLALAGAGITFVEYTFVDLTGRSECHQFGLTSEQHKNVVARIARLIL